MRVIWCEEVKLKWNAEAFVGIEEKSFAKKTKKIQRPFRGSGFAIFCKKTPKTAIIALGYFLQKKNCKPNPPAFPAMALEATCRVHAGRPEPFGSGTTQLGHPCQAWPYMAPAWPSACRRLPTHLPALCRNLKP